MTMVRTGMMIGSPLKTKKDAWAADVNSSRPSANSFALKYKLRPSQRVEYTPKELPNAITAGSESKLKVAFKSKEQKTLLGVDKEEFDTLGKLNMRTTSWNVSQNARSLPPGIVLRLKKDARRKPSRFKACVVAQGNFQADSVN